MRGVTEVPENHYCVTNCQTTGQRLSVYRPWFPCHLQLKNTPQPSTKFPALWTSSFILSSPVFMLQQCSLILPESLTHQPATIDPVSWAGMSYKGSFCIPQVCGYKSFSGGFKALGVFVLCNGRTLGGQLFPPPALPRWIVTRQEHG